MLAATKKTTWYQLMASKIARPGDDKRLRHRENETWSEVKTRDIYQK